MVTTLLFMFVLAKEKCRVFALETTAELEVTWFPKILILNVSEGGEEGAVETPMCRTPS